MNFFRSQSRKGAKFGHGMLEFVAVVKDSSSNTGILPVPLTDKYHKGIIMSVLLCLDETMTKAEFVSAYEIFGQTKPQKYHFISEDHKRINPLRLCGLARDILVLASPA